MFNWVKHSFHSMYHGYSISIVSNACSCKAFKIWIVLSLREGGDSEELGVAMLVDEKYK